MALFFFALSKYFCQRVSASKKVSSHQKYVLLLTVNRFWHCSVIVFIEFACSQLGPVRVPLPFFPWFQKEVIIVVGNVACLSCCSCYSMQKFHLTSRYIVRCFAYVNYLLQQRQVLKRPGIVETSDYI